MPRKFGEIAFTPEVEAAQSQRGSRQTYERYIANGPANDSITLEIAEFIAHLDGFYLGTVSSNGYPYIQFRGGAPGFLKVLNEKTLGFADFSGNVQYITVGNLEGEAKAFLFLMDYRQRRRIKVWGKAEYVEGDSALIEQLRIPGYPAKVERAILFHVEALSENCSQHIPIRYSATEVEAMMAPLVAHAFYASVEQRDNPSYRGKPLVVGGGPNQRGVVAAASYEARKFGIYSAMPSVTAFAKCPGLIFVRPRFDVYREISTSIHAIFKRYSDLVEGVALDEAYLDVTENRQNIPYASTIARHIKTAIFQETQLTATAGVSINKFLAKMASGQNKPNGLTVILPEQAIAFVEQLPIEKFHGIGEVTAAKMHSLGIHTGADLKTRSLTELTHHFGKAGQYYYKIARAEDDRPVEANRVRKSVGAETSFAQDLSDVGQMLQELEQIAQIVEQRLEQHETRGRTLTLKVKFSDYHQITRSKTMLAPISELSTIFEIAKALFESIDLENRSIRLLGISLSNLDNAKQTQVIQLPLFQNAGIIF